MNAKLLEVLRCVKCSGLLRFDSSNDGTGAAGAAGVLLCEECGQAYPVIDSVPRMIVDADSNLLATQQAFSYLWSQRLRGAFEVPGRTYGFPSLEFGEWLVSWCRQVSEIGEGSRWILDAGCGSAEKAYGMALSNPSCEVVALDISGSLPVSRRALRQPGNLHFVQGDACHAPFGPRLFDFVISIGVLHHAPDTRDAFAAVASLAKPGGSFLTWIYPPAGAAPIWSALYRQRDLHFARLGSKLPRAMIVFLAKLYCRAFFGNLARTAAKQLELDRRQFPFRFESLSDADLRRQLLFYSVDNLLPRFQHRHAASEVCEWYREGGYEPVARASPGFYCGQRVD